MYVPVGPKSDTNPEVSFVAWLLGRDLIGYLKVRNGQVEDSYFVPEARGPRQGSADTKPVEAGKLAFQCKLFTSHSANRNDEGDKWARAVGGVLPERAEDQITGVATNMELTLKRIAESNGWTV